MTIAKFLTKIKRESTSRRVGLFCRGCNHSEKIRKELKPVYIWRPGKLGRSMLRPYEPRCLAEEFGGDFRYVFALVLCDVQFVGARLTRAVATRDRGGAVRGAS